MTVEATQGNVNNPAVAKFVLVTATQLPHKCVACGLPATGRNQYVDFQVSFDWEGALYLCTNCADEIARLLGYVSPEDRDKGIEEVEAPVAGLLLELEAEKEKNLALTDELDTVKRLLTHADSVSLLSPLLEAEHERADQLFERLTQRLDGLATLIQESGDSVSAKSELGTSEPDSSE